LQVEESVQQRQLQTLADKLSAEMDLPEGMKIKVHYSDDDIVNAFATMAGNVFFFKGLIEKMPSENALAMVMAHEIAHIKLRHPIVASGRALTVTLALATLGGVADNAMVGSLLNSIGVTSILSFNRTQERDADQEALQALHKHYGHVAGAEALFEVLLAESAYSPPELLSTHPDSERRITRIANYASVHGLRGEPQALPDIMLELETSSPKEE